MGRRRANGIINATPFEKGDCALNKKSGDSANNKSRPGINQRTACGTGNRTAQQSATKASRIGPLPLPIAHKEGDH